MVEVIFINSLGPNNDEIPFESPENVKFLNIVKEIIKKSDLKMVNVNVAPVGGAALLQTEYNLPLENIVEQYGYKFTLLNKGVVG